MKRSYLAALALTAFAFVPAAAAAQQGFLPHWEKPGFDISPDGAWRVKARRVRVERARLLAQRDFHSLNAPMRAARVNGGGAVQAAPAVMGTLLVPFLLFHYQDTDAGTLHDPSEYTALLFGATAPAGRPYSLRTYYEELSTNLFSMDGQVAGWIALSMNEVEYTGGPMACGGGPCNGLNSSDAVRRMQIGLREALAAADASVNFALFDNDGPDGMANSGDDDGYVDMMGFAHATQDGACGGNNHLWSHRFVLANADQSDYQDFVSADPAMGGGFIRVRDYFIQSGVGGDDACSAPADLMPIGTAAHEFGHALGLPDLYDTQSSTEGIGRWGLMGAGNYSVPNSPSRMSAWSLNELGWVTLVPITTDGTYSFGSAAVGDTAFIIDPVGPNPRGEHFMIENRQGVSADTGLIQDACVVWYQSANPPPCDGGLLVWHVDDMKIGAAGNAVNVGTIHGLELQEADGARDLWCPGASPGACNRGDAGDPYPGLTNNTAFGNASNPRATMNSTGDWAGFGVDQITQVVPDGEMSFRVSFAPLLVITTTTTARPPGVVGEVYADALVATGGDGTYAWTITGGALPANLMLATGGAISGTPNTSGNFGFTAQVTSGAQMATHAYTLRIDPPLTITTVATARPAGVEGEAYADTLRATGGDGTYAWTITGGALPGGVNLAATGHISGMPAAQGDYNFTAQVSSGTQVENHAYTLTILAPGTLLQITSTTVARPAGVMGADYADALTAIGGDGTYAWSVVSGALPAGLALAPTGEVTGVPSVTGNFAFSAEVASGGQVKTQNYTLSITAPPLNVAAVLPRLLDPAQTTLTADELRYLDLLGNNNAQFDVGDFKAWVDATGAPPAPPAEQGAKGGRQ